MPKLNIVPLLIQKLAPARITGERVISPFSNFEPKFLIFLKKLPQNFLILKRGYVFKAL